MPAPTVQHEIFRAQLLCARFGLALGNDHSVHAALDDYLKAIRNTRGLMLDMGMQAGCGVCANKNSGSCCFHGMEDNFDYLLLLINLLWGQDVPVARELPGHCLFLSRHGCKLVARYHFCVNYFCADLKNLLRSAQWKVLLAAVGAELSAGWEAEHVVRHWLRARI